MLCEHLVEKDALIEKAEKYAAHWREQCQAISALLPAPSEKATEAPRERLTFMECFLSKSQPKPLSGEI